MSVVIFDSSAAHGAGGSHLRRVVPDCQAQTGPDRAAESFRAPAHRLLGWIPTPAYNVTELNTEEVPPLATRDRSPSLLRLQPLPGGCVVETDGIADRLSPVNGLSIPGYRSGLKHWDVAGGDNPHCSILDGQEQVPGLGGVGSAVVVVGDACVGNPGG